MMGNQGGLMLTTQKQNFYELIREYFLENDNIFFFFILAENGKIRIKRLELDFNCFGLTN